MGYGYGDLYIYIFKCQKSGQFNKWQFIFKLKDLYKY